MRAERMLTDAEMLGDGKLAGKVVGEMTRAIESASGKVVVEVNYSYPRADFSDYYSHLRVIYKHPPLDRLSPPPKPEDSPVPSTPGQM